MNIRVPAGRPKAWLLGAGADVPAPIAVRLMNGLFASVPIFLGGVLNTIVVAAIAVWRIPTAPFLAWLAFEIVLGVIRLAVLVHGRRAQAAGRTPPWLLAALLSCAWSSSVGVGAFLCVTSGDWVLATIACFSTAAMVCGICLRNYGTPRLAAAMVFTAMAPVAVATLLTAEPMTRIIVVQVPIFTVTIFAASFSLHRMMISWMTALGDLERSVSLNQTILQSSPDYTAILDAAGRIVFCHQPDAALFGQCAGAGAEWLSLLAPEDRASAALMLNDARASGSGNLVTYFADAQGRKQWFDIIANRIADDSGRLIVVARDITHQKQTEEQAVWMAQHDTLTGLPNRVVLQDRLEAMLGDADHPTAGAFLLVDVDNFKTINDTLGHDAGDALLCAFANRLQAALAEGDIVARTGGDEFAVIVTVGSEAAIQHAAERIFAQLREPFSHGGRLIECGASIGASIIPRDGKARFEIMKAADIALYAAKAGGRGQLKIFEPAMMREVEKHQAMIASARHALQRDTIIPHYQPKLSLGASHIVGFEALLRWRDCDGTLQGPEQLKGAFDDAALGGAIGHRMLEKVLDDVERWVGAGIAFGHVAVNVAAADFRDGGFAETLLARMRARDIPPACIQIEVTETMFLGRDAGDVEQALNRLSDHGIRIALDDFGTGYASLSHLHQFPVNLLKIDRSFIQRIGTDAGAEAICAAVINLGHCLGLEVVAEGIETALHEQRLAAMGCDTGQGFLYSDAVPGEEVATVLARQHAPARQARRG